MQLLNLCKIALSALRRNKTRSFLTMLGIIIGVASVIALISVGEGSKKSIQNQVSNMGTNLIFIMPQSQNKGGVQMGMSTIDNLTVKDMDAIEKQCTLVSAVSPELRGSGQAIYNRNNWPTSVYGVKEGYLGIKKIDVEKGDMFTARDITNATKVCLIGHTVIKNLFATGEDPIGAIVRFKNIPLKVIGVLASKGENTFGQDQDDLILAPYTTVQKRILATTYVQTITCSARTEEESPLAVAQVTSVLRIQHKIKEQDADDFIVRSQEELVRTFSSISNVLTILLGAIAGISLLVGGIGIMNIMYVSVTERTREIGLRLAVGGKGMDILKQFLVESILLSIIGGIIGILLGIGISSMVSLIMHWPTSILPQSLLLSFTVATVIGVFFGW